VGVNTPTTYSGEWGEVRPPPTYSGDNKSPHHGMPFSDIESIRLEAAPEMQRWKVADNE